MDIEEIQSNRAVDLLAQNKKLREQIGKQNKINDKLSLEIAGLEGTIRGLKFINKLLKRKKEPKLCICCEEITKENAHLHLNCGK